MTAGTGGFFDDFPAFFASSDTGSTRNRLNRRHDGLIGQHAESLANRRVLDLASHDGRWTLAALQAGATHVTGVEARPRLVSTACKTMTTYGISPERYAFVEGDAHEVLTRLPPGAFDTVLCLGFLYHTAHHLALLSAIARLQPADLIIDSDVCPDDRPVVHMVEEDPANEGHAVAAGGDLALVGVPSRSAIELMLRHVGYGTIRYVDWHRLITDWTNLSTYRDGSRVTLRASRTATTPRTT